MASAAVAAVAGADLDGLLLALARGASAVVPASELPRIWGMAEDEALDLAADLETEDWLETWDGTAVPVVILSSRAAERLGLELEPPDTADFSMCRWVRRGESRPPPPPRMPRGARRAWLETDVFRGAPEGTNAARGLDGLPDEWAPDPAAVAEALDPAPKPGVAVRYNQALTYGCQCPWPAAAEAGTPCPGCRERWAHPGRACVICNRACGFDPPGQTPIPDRVADPRDALPRRDATGKAKGKGRNVVAKLPQRSATGLAGGTGKAKPGKVKATKGRAKGTGR